MTSILTAVVLESRDYKEHDRFYTLYTRERGKLRVMGKSARKFASKLAAHMTPFTELTCMLAHGKLWFRLAGVERKRDFKRLRGDLQAVGLGYGLNELLRYAVGNGEKDESLYDFLLDAYEWIARLPDLSRERLGFVHSALTLKWLVMTGIGPHCDACVSCTSDLEAIRKPYISTVHGGLVCATCVGRDRARFADALLVSHELISALRFIAMAPFDTLLTQGLEPLLVDLQNIQDAFVAYHLERELRVTKFIHSISEPKVYENYNQQIASIA